MRTLGLIALSTALLAQLPQTRPPSRNVGTMSELMVKILYPFSDALFYIETRTPTTDAEWARLETETLMLAESANLLMLPGRARDQDRWMADSKLLLDVAGDALEAVKARNVEGIAGLSDRLYESCTSCHTHYRPGYGTRASSSAAVQTPADPNAAAQAQGAELRAIVGRAPRLMLRRTDITAKPPADGWAMGMVSWIAAGRDGLIYLLQRGDKADPIVAINRDGRVVGSWGRGLYVMPHAIRVDPSGNVWTTDAASSMVYKFTADGRKLLEISIGGQPSPCRNNFCGTTDVAFARDGHVFISDGYANARILEYTADGKKVREWGEPGSGPGQFRLPHSIQIDERDVIYVADRENGRVQRFDRAGKFLGEWPKYGKTFSMTLQGQALWLGTQQRNEPNLSPGWLMKVDRNTGEVLGCVDVMGVHGLDVLEDGELLASPGPNAAMPQWFRR
ncbi:MAG: peptidyl-alpha-hydroxyglycine alpha-amidating lyase family protein [Vicinamibacterales bacterium]